MHHFKGECMKRMIGVFLAVSTLLIAETIDLGAISVEGERFSTEIKNISGEELKSADLAEALSRNSASITMIRGSGVANDIILRGQKRDNINVLIDDAKLYGACPNRMDPTVTHINADNIESVKIVEGPYDVENFGTLSGLVVAETKTPTKEPNGDVNLGIGSYGYRKASASASGGNEYIRALLSASTERSDQYKDGNGDTFYDQLAKTTTGTYQYKTDDLRSYEKKTFMGKVFITPVDNQELRLGYTLNRSDNVLYPSRMMDADYDDSDIYTLGYSLYDLGTLSKELALEAFYSTVDHPMSNKYRKTSSSTSYTVNKLETEVQGAKLKNIMDLGGGELTYGVDASKRNWDGKKYTYTIATGAESGVTRTGMPDVDTTNKALFAHYDKTIDRVNVQAGVRYDDTDIKAHRQGVATVQRYDNDYEAFSANTIVTYKATDNVDYFIGFGKASRVPDGKELYGATKSTGILEQTTNYETDLGFKAHYEAVDIKGKLFYSDLRDYIYYNATAQKYVNVDAAIYGATLDASYEVAKAWTLGYGMSYLKGEKDKPLAGQSDKDLADIVPLRAVTSLTYHEAEHTLKTELVAAKRWDNVDSDNGEQILGGYAVLNVKYTYKISQNFDVTVGIDNLFDKTYALSNTYKDLSLLTGTDGDVMLINEPGRYGYINLHYSF